MTSPRALLLGALLVGCGPGPTPQVPAPSPAADPVASPNPAPAPAPVVKTFDARFKGKITAINFGCAVDASCNVVVDGTKHVHFGHDTRGQPPSEWGSADGLWPLMQATNSGVGRTIEVFAATTDHVHYTIEGKAAYFIKLVP